MFMKSKIDKSVKEKKLTPQNYKKNKPFKRKSIRQKLKGIKIKKLTDESTKTPINQESAGAVDTPASDIKAEQEKSSQLLAKYTKLKEQYDFLIAEYANYKRQSLKQQEQTKKYEGEFFIKNLINTVMDDFDRAMNIESKEQTTEVFKSGVAMIHKKLTDLLHSFQVKKSPCKGKPFDPSIHSAISSIKDNNAPPEHIVEVIKDAYYFHDKLLRPAEVIVSCRVSPANDTNKKENPNE